MAKMGFHNLNNGHFTSKSKGQLKLKFYCQMCRKQCRDANAFKCHCLTETHNRQLLLFAENPSSFLSTYSKDFEKAYLAIARIKGKKMKANDIYKEVIGDRNHVHMNSTVWTTLGEFVQHLGKSGKCEVEQIGKDWYVKFINEGENKKERNGRGELNKKGFNGTAIDDDEKDRRFVRKQIEIERKRIESKTNRFSSQLPPGLEKPIETEPKIAKFVLKQSKPNVSAKNLFVSHKKLTKKSIQRKKSAKSEIQRIVEEESQRPKRTENWVRKGLVIKISNEEFQEGRLHNSKGVVIGLNHKEKTAQIEIIRSKEILLISWTQLRPVLPPIGKKGMILKGRQRGEEAKIKSVEKEKKLLLVENSRGETFRLDFNAFCKLSSKTRCD